MEEEESGEEQANHRPCMEVQRGVVVAPRRHQRTREEAVEVVRVACQEAEAEVPANDLESSVAEEAVSDNPLYSYEAEAYLGPERASAELMLDGSQGAVAADKEGRHRRVVGEVEVLTEERSVRENDVGLLETEILSDCRNWDSLVVESLSCGILTLT